MITIPVIARDPFRTIATKSKAYARDLGNADGSHRIAVGNIHIQKKNLVRTDQLGIHYMRRDLGPIFSPEHLSECILVIETIFPERQQAKSCIYFFQKIEVKWEDIQSTLDADGDQFAIRRHLKIFELLPRNEAHDFRRRRWIDIQRIKRGARNVGQAPMR